MLSTAQVPAAGPRFVVVFMGYECIRACVVMQACYEKKVGAW